MENTFKEDVYLNPRVEKPDGIRTADFVFKNELWDLKTIKGTTKRTIENRIKKSIGQSENFVIDTTGFNMDFEDALLYSQNLFLKVDTNFVKVVIVKDSDKFSVFRKK